MVRKPKLLDQVRNTLRLKHYSLDTEKAYVGWIKRFIFFHEKRHPLDMGADEIRNFLTYLAVSDKVAASTQNQALNAIVFLYKQVLHKDPGDFSSAVRAKCPQRLPVVLTKVGPSATQPGSWRLWYSSFSITPGPPRTRFSGPGPPFF